MNSKNLESLERDVTEYVRKFQKFYAVCDSCVNDLMDDHNWDEDGNLSRDWAQINWELFIEREALRGKYILDSLFSGFPGLRKACSKENPNYTVIARSKKPLQDHESNEVVDIDNPSNIFRLRGLLSSSPSGGLCISAPYDIAWLEEESSRKVVSVDFFSLRFYLHKLS